MAAALRGRALATGRWAGMGFPFENLGPVAEPHPGRCPQLGAP